jgi:hypothetical protein
MIRRVAFALILGGLLAPEVRAQIASTATPAAVANPNSGSTPSPQAISPAQPQPQPAPSDLLPPPPPTPVAIPDRQANAPQAAGPAQNQAGHAALGAIGNGRGNARRPAEAQGRFANPGGVGRYSEYYTPNTPMWGHPGSSIHPAAGFGRGGGPTRQDQIEALRVGQYRTQNIQNNINAYGRPIGFGIGFGFGGLGGYR